MLKYLKDLEIIFLKQCWAQVAASLSFMAELHKLVGPLATFWGCPFPAAGSPSPGAPL